MDIYIYIYMVFIKSRKFKIVDTDVRYCFKGCCLGHKENVYCRMESRILISTHFNEVCSSFYSVVAGLTFVGKEGVKTARRYQQMVTLPSLLYFPSKGIQHFNTELFSDIIDM